MIPSGYKQTKIGIIPEDWEVKDFGEVGNYYKGGGISMRDVRPTGFPCIMYGDIYVKFDTGFKKCDYRIDYDTAKNSVKASPQDLFFTASGETADDIGRCVSYQGEDNIYIGGDIIALHLSDEYDSLFLAYVQNSEKVKKQKASFAQGHSVVHISADNIKKTLFAAPKYPEQKRIAEALSDVDEVIESLEKLIEKKKALKQGVMQELLTGKRRLQGFTGEWIETSFESIYSFAKEGGTPSTSNELYYKNGGIPFIKIEDLAMKYIDTGTTYITNKGVEHSSAWIIPANSVILSNGATIGEVSINRIPVATKQGILGIIPDVSIDIEFLYYLFSTTRFRDEVKRITTHGTMDCAYLKDLNTIRLFIPSDKNEQIKISSILSDIDNEIVVKERELQKYRRLKSGMMSELLTGRIRLV